MNKLSKREKVLLYILLCFLLCIGGIYLLILPALNRYGASATRYQELSHTQRIMQQTIAGLEETKQSIEVEREEAASEGDYFYSVMDNEEIDRMITDLVLKHSLTPVSFSMTQTEEKPLAAYEKEDSQSSSSASGSSASSSSAASSDQEQGPMLLTNTVSMQFKGERDNVIELVDEISRLDSIMVTNVTMDNTGKADPPYTMTLELYMLESVDVE